MSFRDLHPVEHHSTQKNQREQVMANAVLSVHTLPLNPAAGETSNSANQPQPPLGRLVHHNQWKCTKGKRSACVHTHRQHPACRLWHSVPDLRWVQPKRAGRSWGKRQCSLHLRELSGNLGLVQMPEGSQPRPPGNGDLQFPELHAELAESPTQDSW